VTDSLPRDFLVEAFDFLVCGSQLPLLRFRRVPFGQRGIYINQCDYIF